MLKHRPEYLYEIFPEAHPGKFDASDEAVWFIHLEGDQIAGVMFAEERGPGVWYFAGGLVKPAFRRQGIFTKLHAERTQYVIDHAAQIIFAGSSPMNRQVFINEGWTPAARYNYAENFTEVFFFKCVGVDQAQQ